MAPSAPRGPDAVAVELTRAFERDAPVELEGARSGVRALLLAHLLDRLPAGRRVVYVGPDDARVRRVARDTAFFAGLDPRSLDPGSPVAGGPLLYLPEPDESPYADRSADPRRMAARMGALARLRAPRTRIVFATVRGLSRRVLPPSLLEAHRFELRAGLELDRMQLEARLCDAGYARTELVEDPGEFAVRGGIVDVYVPLAARPVRLEFFGDELESLRAFEPTSQRSTRELESLEVHPVRETIAAPGVDLRRALLEVADRVEAPSAESRRVLEALEQGREFFGREALTPIFHETPSSVFDYLGAEYRVWVDERGASGELAERQWEAEVRRYERARAQGRLACRPDRFFVVPAELRAAFAGAVVRSTELELDDAPAGSPGSSTSPRRLGIAARSNLELRTRLEGARARREGELLRPLIETLDALEGEGPNPFAWRVILVCPNRGHGERLLAMLEHYQRPGRWLEPDAIDWRSRSRAPGDVELHVAVGALSEGFCSPPERLLVLSESELFGPRVRKHRRGRKRRSLASLGSLGEGDYVVHMVHGIGRYRGLTRLEVGGQAGDFATIEYAGKDRLFLPAHRIHEVERFVAADAKAPRLDRLGGQTFEAKRTRVKRDVRQFAEELLTLYAQREAESGHAHPELAESQAEFAATFPFEETPDQLEAIEAVQADLGAERPMDRLVCGDVGFGKTEVALRAAFRVAMSGKQVAVLAPTTVLVQQHYLTFKERMSAFPVEVAALNRFASAKAIKQVRAGLAEGRVDVVIGTHRLLSRDLRFADLGLVVIDEEQRFGVRQKERFKRLKTRVDVLSMSATPIPRTLHMALLGMREISLITTPPSDRLAIRSYVSASRGSALEEGIERELARGGQVFYVVPRILGIEEHAQRIRDLFPRARVGVAHGQMPAELLEGTMMKLLEHELDILVCTTIIESGLDISRANTMFIARADLFGLAQLHQLRGRIGRGKLRAHCYFLVDAPERMSPDAQRRLRALARNSELGAGFNLASEDLEIRGAGDLLGKRQHGNISAIGFEAFTRLLAEAVAELRGDPILHEHDVELAFDLPAFLPDDYVPDTGQRLDFYRRMSGAREPESVRDVMAELHDRFGELPVEARHFAALMVLKTLAMGLGARSLELRELTLTLRFDDADPSPARLLAEPVVDARARLVGSRLCLDLPERSGEDCERWLEQAASILGQMRATAATAGRDGGGVANRS